MLSSRIEAASCSLCQLSSASAPRSLLYRTVMPVSLWFGSDGLGHQPRALVGEDLLRGRVGDAVPKKARGKSRLGVEQPSGFCLRPLPHQVRSLVLEPGLGLLTGL